MGLTFFRTESISCPATSSFSSNRQWPAESDKNSGKLYPFSRHCPCYLVVFGHKNHKFNCRSFNIFKDFLSDDVV